MFLSLLFVDGLPLVSRPWERSRGLPRVDSPRIVLFQRIWDANEPTSFVAHSYDFAINGYVSLCGRSYQKSATCLRFIKIYVDFQWFWFTSFRSCCERNKGKLGTNYGAINELQVCLVLHSSCSFQSCDCFKICRIDNIYIYNVNQSVLYVAGIHSQSLHM